MVQLIFCNYCLKLTVCKVVACFAETMFVTLLQNDCVQIGFCSKHFRSRLERGVNIKDFLSHVGARNRSSGAACIAGRAETIPTNLPLQMFCLLYKKVFRLQNVAQHFRLRHASVPAFVADEHDVERVVVTHGVGVQPFDEAQVVRERARGELIAHDAWVFAPVAAKML